MDPCATPPAPPAIPIPTPAGLPRRMSFRALSRMTREEIEQFERERPHDAKRFIRAHMKRLRREGARALLYPPTMPLATPEEASHAAG